MINFVLSIIPKYLTNVLNKIYIYIILIIIFEIFSISGIFNIFNFFSLMMIKCLLIGQKLGNLYHILYVIIILIFE